MAPEKRDPRTLTNLEHGDGSKPNKLQTGLGAKVIDKAEEFCFTPCSYTPRDITKSVLFGETKEELGLIFRRCALEGVETIGNSGFNLAHP